jgi:hypothetical protein
MRSFKPSHGIGSEHGFPNTIYEHDFSGLFPGHQADIRVFPIPRFSEYHTIFECGDDSSPMGTTPTERKSQGQTGDKHRRKRRIPARFRAEPSRFTYL